LQEKIDSEHLRDHYPQAQPEKTEAGVYVANTADLPPLP